MEVWQMSKLVGRGIVKTYGKKTVLQDVNLMLEEHKIYGMIGRNGAGKTTLLYSDRAESGQQKGEILWNGIPVWEKKEALSHICFSRELRTGVRHNERTASKIICRLRRHFSHTGINRWQLHS